MLPATTIGGSRAKTKQKKKRNKRRKAVDTEDAVGLTGATQPSPQSEAAIASVSHIGAALLPFINGLIPPPPVSTMSASDEDASSSVESLLGGGEARLAHTHINFFLPALTSSSISLSSSLRSSRKGKTKEKEKERAMTDQDGAVHSPVMEEPPKQKRNLEVKIVRSGFSQESFELYKRYSSAIHEKDEEITEKSYCEFLVNTPLVYIPEENEESEGTIRGENEMYGSFHHLYLLDGTLIAVGVVDVLFRSITSVYFFYDPDYAFLSLGVYSALKEIEFVQNLRQRIPSFQYYFMAYYVHSCPKMNYKARYRPSELLCPVTYQWVPLDEAVRRLTLNEGRCTAFVSADPQTIENMVQERQSQMLPIEQVPLLYNDSLINFEALGNDMKYRVRRLLEQWVSLVSPSLASKIVLSLQW